MKHKCFDHLEEDAVAKVIFKKKYAKEYSQKHIYFCSECLITLIECGWTGGGPFLSDAKKIIVLLKGRYD